MTACLVAVLGHISRGGDEVFAGLAGLSISFALSITSTLTWTVRMASDLEANSKYMYAEVGITRASLLTSCVLFSYIQPQWWQ